MIIDEREGVEGEMKEIDSIVCLLEICGTNFGSHLIEGKYC